MWMLGPFIARYRRRTAFIAASAMAAVIYGLVDQSTRPEVQAWYWPAALAVTSFMITRLIVSRLIGRFVGGVRRHLR
ncbi:hypothetical protein [Thalassospira sp. MCCC 1A02491]|uniref:hypothetical protein n=1 Tax=Thalassospira sp. MCCC 1A02491 TaxID=1769751 RepID=UPI0007AD6CF1|nr:hypothetical protein [Thalassospira sp. MCCC 1A02491]KZB61695.1 hypothetical protein AUQ42_15510 [Thalassospira sp. MCCC 1A02491]